MRERDDDDRRRDRDLENDARDERPPRRRAKKGMSTTSWVVVGLLLIGAVGFIVLLIPPILVSREAASRSTSSNNMKQVGIAAHGYHDSNAHFTNGPYAGLSSPNTELSFRVELLPYLEQDNLYKQFRKDEAWDSATNRPLANTVIKPFASPLDSSGTATTRCRGFVGPGSVFEPGAKVTMASITDGTAHTIYVVMADDGVIWSKPDELNYTANGSLPTIGQKAYSHGTHITMCDGSVRFLRKKTSEPVLRALITRNGNDALPLDW